MVRYFYILLNLAFLLISQTVFAQYCTPAYLTGNTAGDYISIVEVGDIYNSTGQGASSYTYYSGLNTNLTSGLSDTVWVTNTPTWPEYVAIWIDYDQDEVFEAQEKLGEQNLSNGQVGVFPFIIPTNAAFGQTRMRVRAVYSFSNIDPCTSATFGEAEDYPVTIVPNGYDAGILLCSQPVSGCTLNATESVFITLGNFGLPANSFPIAFSLNGGTIFRDTVMYSLPPGGSVSSFLSSLVDLSVPGTYLLKLWTELPGDTFPQNDTLVRTIVHYDSPISIFPYFDDFESGISCWATGGVNSSWDFGTPILPVINGAASGDSCWVTANGTNNQAGLYNNNEQSWVESPVFDFSNVLIPSVEMKAWWESDNNSDGAALQASTDGGNNWAHVGDFGDSVNWYTDTLVAGLGWSGLTTGWSGELGAGSGGWVTSSHVLTYLSGEPDVRFRVVFGADGLGRNEGFAFDDFAIIENPPFEAAMIDLVSPGTEGCIFSNAETVEVRYANTGPMPFSGVNLYYAINGGLPVIETDPATLMPGDTAHFQFQMPVDLSAGGEFELTVWLEIAGDPYAGNDTIQTVLALTGGISSFPYFEGFDNGGANAFGWLNDPFDDGQQWTFSTGSQSASGPGYDHTSGSGYFAFVDDNAFDNSEVNLISPCFDLANLANPAGHFWYFSNEENQADTASTQSYLHVDLRTPASAWTLDALPAIGHVHAGWNAAFLDLSVFAGDTIQLRFRVDNDNNSSDGHNIAIDDFRLFDRIADDIGLLGFILPDPTECGAESTPVELVVANFGTTAQSTFNIGIDTAGLISPSLVFAYTGTLSPGQVDTVPACTLNTLSGAFFNLTAYTQLASDGNPWNDTIFYNSFLQMAGPPPPIVNEGVSCGPGPVTLSVDPTAYTAFWYDSAAVYPIATGNSYVTPTLQDDAAYWVRLAQPSSPTGNLANLDAPSWTLNAGNMFNLTAFQRLLVSGFDILLNNTNPATIRVYTTPNTYVGKENNAAAWTLLWEQSVQGLGAGIPTPLPFPEFEMAAGQTVGMYITISGGSNSMLSKAGGLNTAQNSELKMTFGTSNSYPFGSFISTRKWNGRIYYTGLESGCIGPLRKITAFVSDPLNVDLGPDSTSCGPQVLDATTPGGLSYSWSTGEMNTATITATQSGAYWVFVTDSLGCAWSDTTQLLILGPPLDLGPDTIVCNPLILDAGPGGDSFLWSTGDTTQTTTVSVSGTYFVEKTNLFGCTAFDTIQVTVKAGPGPTVSLPSNPGGCDSTSLAPLSGPFSSYLWSTGDTTASIQIDMTGAYWISVKDSTGCTARDTTFAIILDSPVSLLPADTASCFPILLDPGPGGNSYLWSTGDTTQTITASGSGLYTVTLTEAFGICSTVDSVQLTIYPSPVVDLGPDTTACDGYTLDAGNPGAFFFWSNGAGTQTLPVFASGTYSVIVVDNNFCAGYDTAQVTLSQSPIVDLGPDTVACVSYTMNAGNPGASYLWSNGATNQFLGVGTSGTYWVQVTEPLGCIGSDTLNLTIAPNPVVNLGPDFTQCDSAVLDAGNPGSSFLWSGGQTTQLIPVYSTGAYGLTVTDGNGCSASDNINVTIGTTPSVDLGPDTAVCDTLFLLDAGNGPGSDFYSWSTGATTQSVLISASGTYWVAVSDTEGCTALDSISLTLNSGIVVDLGQDTAICSGTYLYSGIPGASYLWSTGETTISISISTSGYYFVTVTDTNGCQGFDDVNLTVIPGPVVDLGPDTAYCGGPVFLDAGPGMASYLWSDGTTTQLFEVPNSGTFYVDVIDMNGCPGEDMVDIDIYPVPVVDIGPDTVVCGPLILDAGNQPPGSAFVWNTAETTQAITVSASGTYSVAVINSFGCELSDTILITAGMAPVVDLGSDTAVCGNIVLDAGNPANSFLWSNGATTAQTQITTSGLVWVVVTDPAGCSASDSILVTVNPYPAVDLGPDRQACTSELLDAANPGSTYLWSTGSSSQTLSVSSSGIYWVEVTDPSGCAASDTVLITITGTPLVDLGPDTLVCGSYVLDAGNPGATFAWSTGATTQTITVSTTGFYFVTVTSLPACIGSDLVNVTVNPGPGPMVDLGPDTTVCNSYLLDAGNPGDSYLWSTGATTQTITITSSGIYSVLVTEASGCADFDEIALTIPANPVVDLGPDTAACDLILLDAGNPGDTYVWSTGATTQTIMVSQSGVYFVTVANPEGCIGSDLINVTVSASPQADLGPDTVSCNPVLLDAANPGLTYLWSNGAGTQSISATLSGTYWVNVTNAAGCISSDTVQVTIDKPIVNLGPDTTVCDNIVLDAGNPGSIFAWSTSATTQTITASSSGFYFVTVTGATGCISSDLVNITVLTGPPPVVDLGPDTSACEAIWLDAGNPGSTYSWTNGATTQTLMVPISGTYGVTVTGPGGCTAYDEAVIQIYNSPVVDLGPDAVKCNNLILDAGNPGAGFLWNTGATTQTISVSASGEYSVQVTTPDGCAAADTIQVSCCGKDSFEPNNVMADAANLYGGALAGWSEMRICPQGDVDFFEVKLNVAGTIRVTLGNPFFNADVELLNAGGILASSSNSGTATDVINYPNAPAGTYYVRVFGAAGAWSENSTYKLVVSTLLPAPSGGIIKNIPKDPIFRTLAPDLKVYPNPTAGPLTLEFSNGRGDPAELSLYDVSGRRLLTEKHETGRGLSVIRLDPGQIPEGVYFLEVRMDGYFWREKLIVSKR